MSIVVTWKCDGCDDELVVKDARGEASNLRDWKRITVTIEGFKGYPVPEDVNGPREYELCPDCQRRVSGSFFPRLWARIYKEPL